MSVSTTTRTTTFDMDGVETDFDFTFQALPDYPSYIKATIVALSTGTETALTYGAGNDYTVSLNNDGVGGTATVADAQDSSYQLILYRESAKKQETDYADYNQFPADTLETSLDRAILILQELAEDTDRCLKVPISSTLSSIEIPDGEPNKILAWNPSGTTIVNQTGLSTTITQCYSYATTATKQAREATTQATTASSHATTAANQAETAATEATTASSHATTATNQASISSSEATTSSSHATTAESAATAALKPFYQDEFTGDDATTDFSLSATPRTNSLLVFLQGILQESGGGDYTLSVSTLQFSNAPKTGRKVLAYYAEA